MAHLNSPLIEFFPTGVHRTGYTLFTELFDGEPEAVDGWVELGPRRAADKAHRVTVDPVDPQAYDVGTNGHGGKGDENG